MNIKDWQGIERTLSDEVYVISEAQDKSNKDYQAGSEVRLISGVDGSSVPGYHFEPGYKTVCSVKAKIAGFIGVREIDLKIKQGVYK